MRGLLGACLIGVTGCAGSTQLESDLGALVCEQARTCEPEAWAILYDGSDLGDCITSFLDNREVEGVAAQCTLNASAAEECRAQVEQELASCDTQASRVLDEYCSSGVYDCDTACVQADAFARGCGTEDLIFTWEGQPDRACLAGSREDCVATCVLEEQDCSVFRPGWVEPTLRIEACWLGCNDL